MATGRLGSAAIAATTNTTLYQVPVGKTAVCNINLCNTSASAITVRIALADAATPIDGEYIEYDVSLPANGVLERGGIVLDAEKYITVYASASGIHANAWGYEE